MTINEPYFQGHFPHRPVMPGVIIIEALAQAAGVLAFVTAGVYPDENSVFYFVGIDKARFRKPVEPGDQLILQATLERNLRGIWKLSAVASVGAEPRRRRRNSCSRLACRPARSGAAGSVS